MKKYIAAILMAMLGYSTSCNVLEIEPVSEILADNFYRDAASANAATMSIYNRIIFSLADNVYSSPAVMSDEAVMTRGGNFTRHHNFEPTPVQGNVGNFWQNFYEAIQLANDLIESVPGIQDPSLNKEAVLGEALFLRSMSLFFLTRMFGDIPLVITASKSANDDFLVARTPRAQVFEQIVQDLQQAIEGLPNEAPNRARASKGAAKALLVKVYTYRNAEGDLDKALQLIEEIMNDSQYGLVEGDQYESIFKVGQQNTKESLFEFSYRPNTAVAGHQLEQETVPYPGNLPRVVPTQKLIDAYNLHPEDKRIVASLGFHNNRYYSKKFQRNDVTEVARTPQANNLVMLRLADMILLRAEILNEKGQVSQALTFLNQIRQRAGIPPINSTDQNEVRLAIENERFLELSFEGHRWHDLVRTGRAQDLCAPRLTNPDRILWPIPGRDLDLNPNLTQNPSY